VADFGDEEREMKERAEQQEEGRKIDLDTPEDGKNYIQNIENPKETERIEEEKVRERL
jgi:hypothetical protein